MRKAYQAIIVGARCAGSPMAMLLARKGYRVLMVDRANFPSDTLSTHVVQPLGVAALSRWGLLERLVETGVPPMTHMLSTLVRSPLPAHLAPRVRPLLTARAEQSSTNCSWMPQQKPASRLGRTSRSKDS